MTHSKINQNKLHNYLGEFNLDNDIRERIGKGKILTHISLFAGCGGLDIGFAQAGIQTRAMVEWSKDACATLRANWLWEQLKERKCPKGKPIWNSKAQMKKVIKWYHEPEPVIIQKDITTLSTEEILKAANLEVGECSIISAGFPCQGFSTQGKRMIDDPRNVLYKEFVRVVNEAKPALLFGENVPGLVYMAKGHIMNQICEDLAGCGYDISWDILNAADYGVPQKRRRVIIIGKRNDVMEFLEEDRPRVHLGSVPGTISHPEWFVKKYKINSTKLL